MKSEFLLNNVIPGAETWKIKLPNILSYENYVTE